MKKASVKKAVILNCSPRKNGNCFSIAEFLKKRLGKDFKVSAPDIGKIKIAACIECGKCDMDGICKVRDDFQSFSAEIVSADVVVFISPVFFMALPGKIKSIIDRFQSFWVRKFVLRKQMPAKKGYIALVRGNKRMKGFKCVAKSVRAFFAVCDIVPEETVLCSGLEKGNDFGKREDCKAVISELAIKITKVLDNRFLLSQE